MTSLLVKDLLWLRKADMADTPCARAAASAESASEGRGQSNVYFGKPNPLNRSDSHFCIFTFVTCHEKATKPRKNRCHADPSSLSLRCGIWIDGQFFMLLAFGALLIGGAALNNAITMAGRRRRRRRRKRRRKRALAGDFLTTLVIGNRRPLSKFMTLVTCLFLTL